MNQAFLSDQTERKGDLQAEEEAEKERAGWGRRGGGEWLNSRCTDLVDWVSSKLTQRYCILMFVSFQVESSMLKCTIPIAHSKEHEYI